MRFIQWTTWVLSAVLALGVGAVGGALVWLFWRSPAAADRRLGFLAVPVVVILALYPWSHVLWGTLPPSVWWTVPSVALSGLLIWFGMHAAEAAARP